MAHEILGQRFYGHREPGWHHLGRVSDADESAREVYTKMGTYRVWLAPLLAEMPAGVAVTTIPVNYRAILRGPIPEDEQVACFGTVSPEYTLVTPDEFVALWDEHVARPVETAGILRDGKMFFLTARMGAWSVRGDEQESYLVVGNWMDGANAATAMLTRVRTVCMNTYRMGESASTELRRFVHDRSIKVEMAGWLTGLVARMEERDRTMREAAEVMASRRIHDVEEVSRVMNATYPLPAPPEPVNEGPVPEAVLKEYEAQRGIMAGRQHAAVRLFLGEGRGMASKATAGTAWGLFQSVVELADYRSGGSDRGAASSALLGDRAVEKARAFDACLTLARN